MTKLKLTNEFDRQRVQEGQLAPGEVRSTEVEALVDTGATQLVLPADVCQRLGLRYQGTRRVRYADGRTEEVPWVVVHMEVLGRASIFTALVQPAGTTPLIGQIPLEELDFIVDPKSRELRVNPASPDAPLLDILAAG